jgi:hypothetical protein
MLRAKRLHNRPLQLLNAYFLGKLLEKEAEPFLQRGYYLQKLSAYYQSVTVRTYYLFETLGTRKIINTRRTTLTAIRRINTDEFQDLVVRTTVM